MSFVLQVKLALTYATLFLAVAANAQTPPNPPLLEQFYVSPKGDDRWSGRRADPDGNDGPFATVSRARDAVRALLKSRTNNGPVRVTIGGGIYFLDRPLEFGPEDSGADAQNPIVYTASLGDTVVLSGGRRLTGGRWGMADGKRVWEFDVPDAKDGSWRFRHLFVNGERRWRTRLPRKGEYRIESLPGYTGDFLRSPTKQFVYAAGHIQETWRNLRDVEVVGITRWLENRLPIESVESKNRVVTFDRPSLFALVSSAPSGDGTATPSVYWVENVFEAMDTPGQWYLDRAQGTLYYVPLSTEDITRVEIIAPRLTRVLTMTGDTNAPVHDIHFEGITFSHTEWLPPADYASSLQAGVEVPGAIYFDFAERCRIIGGAIEHIGNCGIEVNVGCADIEISHNKITDIGAGAIRVGHFFSWETDGSGKLTERGRQRKAAMPTGRRSRRITITDNEISQCGLFSPESAGIFVGDNAENKITHNHVYDIYWSGICVGSVQNFGPSQAQNNIVEHNHVHDIGKGLLSDVAGIYTCSSPGTRIRFNRVHDITRRDYGGWGIYTDEGAHDLLIEKNVVYKCQDGGLFAHHSRNITAVNNVFAFNRHTQVERYGVGGFELIFQRNLVLFREGTAIGPASVASSSTNLCLFDRNIYWKASGGPPTFGGKNLTEWQTLGQDRHSLVTDPLFARPEGGDFQLQPGSPAEKIGFQPWDHSSVGPRMSPRANGRRSESVRAK